jgi:hypothetical protein
MNAAAITSTASAVQTIPALAERARIRRLDQRLRGQPRRAFGARADVPTSHGEPGARANPSIGPSLPDALTSSFGPISRDSPAGLAGPADMVPLRTPGGRLRPGSG